LIKVREHFSLGSERGFPDLILLFVAERQRQNQFSHLRFPFYTFFLILGLWNICIFLVKRVLRSNFPLRCFGCRFNLNLMSDAFVLFLPEFWSTCLSFFWSDKGVIATSTSIFYSFPISFYGLAGKTDVLKVDFPFHLTASLKIPTRKYD
jgi:hypothetical protein